MTQELKNLIIETQIELERSGEAFLETIQKSKTYTSSSLHTLFIKQIFISYTNAVRQYLQLIQTDEKSIESTTLDDIKKQLRRCSVKAWNELADLKKRVAQSSTKYLILSEFKKDYKKKVKEIQDIEQKISDDLNLSLQEKLELFKEIVEKYNDLETTPWVKNPLLTVSVIGIAISLISVIILLLK